MKMTMMMTRGESADEVEDGAGGVLRASGAGAKNTEGKDGNDDDEVGEKGDAGGGLRAFGADDGGLENKDRDEGDEDSDAGGAGGVLRAFGADADGGAGGVLRASGADDDVDDDHDDGDCERRSITDGRGGKPGVVT